LKDDFAKNALRVVKKIEAETGGLSMGSDGGILVPTVTNQAIDDLDIDAQTKADHAVVQMLNDFFLAKLGYNMKIRTISALVSAASIHLATVSIGTDSPRRRLSPLEVADLVAKSPTVLLIHVKESACAESLELILRARTYKKIDVCSEESLSVTTPKELDVSVN
jgi:hypothetical protein